MTSSLVGSEMCIRDRLDSVWEDVAPGGQEELQSWTRCVRDPGVANTAEAVSYTHLTLPTICSV
eukprot:3660716-Prorocentrum_lima.AAC.1